MTKNTKPTIQEVLIDLVWQLTKEYPRQMLESNFNHTKLGTAKEQLEAIIKEAIGANEKWIPTGIKRKGKLEIARVTRNEFRKEISANLKERGISI